MNRRVVVTGIGLVSALGVGTEATWEGLCAGRSGVGPITKFDATAFAARIAAEVKGFDPLQYVDKKDVKKMDTFIHYAIAASQAAAADSGLVIGPENASRVGVFIASGIGGLRDHRAGAPEPARRRAAQDLAVLHPRGDHQPRRRAGVDQARRQGPEPRDVDGLRRRRRMPWARRSRSSGAARPTP